MRQLIKKLNVRLSTASLQKSEHFSFHPNFSLIRIARRLLPYLNAEANDHQMGTASTDALSYFLQRDFNRSNQSLVSFSNNLTTNANTSTSSSSIIKHPRIEHNIYINNFYESPTIPSIQSYVISYICKYHLPSNVIKSTPKTIEQFFINLLSSSSSQTQICKHLYNSAGPIALYNIAVIAYHQNFIHAAVSITDVLIEYIEAIDESLVLSICFLTADVHLRIFNISAAESAIRHADKILPLFKPTSNININNNSNNSNNNNNNTLPAPSSGRRVISAGITSTQTPNAETSPPRRTSIDLPRTHSTIQQHQQQVTRTPLLSPYRDPEVLPQYLESQKRTSSPLQIPELSPPWQGRKTTLLHPPSTFNSLRITIHLYHIRIKAYKFLPEAVNHVLPALSLLVPPDNGDDEQHYKTQAEYETQANFEAAVMITKSRAEQEQYRGRHDWLQHVIRSEDNAITYLSQVIKSCKEEIQEGKFSNHNVLRKVWPIVYNSLGIIYHKMGRHALAACYFERSRMSFDEFSISSSSGSSNSSNSGGGVQAMNGNAGMKDSHVSYNLALQYMKCGNHKRALYFFDKCAKADVTMRLWSPLLWIRMAECCVAMEGTGREEGRRSSLCFEGRGRSRRMIMRAGDDPDVAAMQYAVCCSKAALNILDKRAGIGHYGIDDENGSGCGRTSSSSLFGEHSHDKINGNGNGNGLGNGNGNGPGHGLGHDHVNNNEKVNRSKQDERDKELRGASYTLIAYASLSFDANETVKACDNLSKLYKPEDERWTLAQLYAAEAFCMLGQAEQGRRKLNPLLSASFPLESDVREAAYVNMALTHACFEGQGGMGGACKAARVALKMYASGSKRQRDIRKQAVFAAAYIFLRDGDVEAAKDALRMIHHPSGE